MHKLQIGITGQSGFIGTHLYNTLGLYPDEFERIHFEDYFFHDTNKLREFVRNCNVIVHLAAVNRHPYENELYKINVNLVNSLIDAMIKENVRPYVLFSSSIQEDLMNTYGKSKKEGRILFMEWAKKYNAQFAGLIIPNVYGPFGMPSYNSFIATFCHKMVCDEIPAIITDNNVNLIYVSSLCRYILEDIREVCTSNAHIIKEYKIPPDFTKKVSEISSLLQVFKDQYLRWGIIPELCDRNEINLFNTFRSYIDLAHYFPRHLKLSADNRGAFVETIRSGVGGQVSFSTTKSAVTRGNHYHTRKIERFIVIKGRAKIQLRKVGTHGVIEYELDGYNPSYVDMPIWYTHNITNIGSDDLYTQFWINEWYNESDPDTYFEQV
jgi:UDP-2-acetamido-2,6-beta-L-arabino-hexul-4-ose reductase